MPINQNARGNPNAGNLEQFVGGMNKAAEGIREQSQPMRTAQAQAALRQFIAGQEGEEMQKRLELAQHYMERNAGANRKVSIGIGKENVSLTQNEPSYLIQQGRQQSQEAKALASLADKTFKPHKAQLEASENTLGYLDQGNAAADKAAWINEAAMLAGGAGSRGVATIASALGFKPTSGNIAVDLQNWLNNTADPNMLASQRNALREMVIQRMPSLQKQYQSAKQGFMAQAPIIAPSMAAQGNMNNITDSFVMPLEQGFTRMSETNKKYMDQKAQAAQAGQNTDVSHPSQYSSQQTTMEKLGSWLGIRPKQPQPAAPQAAQSQAPAQVPQTAPQSPSMGQPQSMRVKHKASGATGTIPSHEFDPNVYEQVQ